MEKLDLMDWKQIEREATATIRSCVVQIELSRLMLNQAKKKVKELGGSTLEQEEERAKQQQQQPNPATV